MFGRLRWYVCMTEEGGGVGLRARARVSATPAFTWEEKQEAENVRLCPEAFFFKVRDARLIEAENMHHVCLVI